MGILIEGIWRGGDSQQIGTQGWEPRQERLNGYVRANGKSASNQYPAEAGRYHLIECPGCPLAQRVSIVHRLKKLGNVVSTSMVRPVMGDHGREFGTAAQAERDPLTGFRYLYELYVATDPHYSGRASTPVLWDKQTGKIVSNNTTDIFAMFNREFNAFTDSSEDYRPPNLEAEISAELALLYTRFVSVIYKCGFAREQSVYEENAAILEASLDDFEQRLSRQPYLLGDHLTEADWMLFVSLIRYDAIYIPLFKCTQRRLEDSAVLTHFIQQLYALPGVAETFNMKLAMMHYFISHAHINPTRIVPRIPRLSWYRRDG